MNKKNIESLGARLELLGFEHTIRERLAAYCCFDPVGFDIGHSIVEGKVSCRFIVHCMKGELGLYDAVSFSGTLRRDVAVPEGCEILDKEMSQVDWAMLYSARDTLTVSVDIPAMAEKAHRLLSEISSRDISGMVRYKHWVGTPLEEMVPNLGLHRSKFEVSQRFYLLPDEMPISFRDAMRFLQSRWMEKRITADKRLLLKKKDETDNGRAGGGKLLTKRIRPNRRPA